MPNRRRDRVSARREFSVLVGLDRAELERHIANHPDVECLDGLPEPSRRNSSRRFQAWPVGEGWVLRRSVAAFDAPDAPIVDLMLTPSRRGTRLRGRFLRFPAVEQAGRIRDSAFLAIPVAVVTFEAMLLGAPALAFVMPLVCVFMYFGVASNRVRRRAMQRHAPALWSLVGELFAPHALPDAEDENPFRGDQPVSQATMLAPKKVSAAITGSRPRRLPASTER